MTKSGREQKIRNEEVFIHPLTFRHRVNTQNRFDSGENKNIRFSGFADWQLFIFVRKTYHL
jgi:hypothetical protein